MGKSCIFALRVVRPTSGARWVSRRKTIDNCFSPAVSPKARSLEVSVSERARRPRRGDVRTIEEKCACNSIITIPPLTPIDICDILYRESFLKFGELI